MLDAVRYWLAFLTLGSMPAAVLYWYLVHPLVDFWRAVGKVGTWAVMALLFVVNLTVVWVWRDTLLSGDLGVRQWMWLPGIVLYVAAALIELQCRKQLKFSVLAGSPELSRADGDRGRVLDQGIYARLRHPRYVSVILGTAGFAFLLNYDSVWVLLVLMVPALYGVVLLEERELHDRFGGAYAEYARTVPRFLPRRMS